MNPVEIRPVLLHAMHRAIDDAARHGLQSLAKPDGSLSYPPGVQLSDAEMQALRALSISGDLRSALTKVLRDTASAPLFQLFAFLDGVADPQDWNGLWLGAQITVREDEEDSDGMWHDDFFDSYWLYDKHRAPDV